MIDRGTDASPSAQHDNLPVGYGSSCGLPELGQMLREACAERQPTGSSMKGADVRPIWILAVVAGGHANNWKGLATKPNAYLAESEGSSILACPHKIGGNVSEKKRRGTDLRSTVWE